MAIPKPDCLTCPHSQCIIKNSSQHREMVGYGERKTVIQCKKGQNLIIEGAPVNGLFFVNKGKIKVSKSGLNGKDQIVRIAGEGEIIGHRGFGVGQFYQIGAIALEDTLICNFSNAEMKEMLHSIPSLTYDLMIFYAEELNRSETKVKKFAQMTVREKIIDALLYINRKFGQNKGFLEIQLSRKEIADFAGTTEEQVIRTLSTLKKEGLVMAAGKKLGIKNVLLLSKEISEHNHFLDS